MTKDEENSSSAYDYAGDRNPEKKNLPHHLPLNSQTNTSKKKKEKKTP
jgi:hypothetical protein